MSKWLWAGWLVVSTAAWSQQLREGAPGTEAWHAVVHEGVQRINVECAEDLFDPAEIVVRAHVPVELAVRGTSETLVFVNQGFVPDNRPIGKNPSAHRFLPSTPGRYEMSCQPRTGAPGKVRKGVLHVRP